MPMARSWLEAKRQEADLRRLAVDRPDGSSLVPVLDHQGRPNADVEHSNAAKIRRLQAQSFAVPPRTARFVLPRGHPPHCLL